MKVVSAQLKIKGKDKPFFYREDSHGDIGVIQQIFVNNDYDVLQWPQGKALLSYHDRVSQSRPSLIIDAGANIGASAIFFASHYGNSRIFAIEPDEANWQLLSINTSGLDCFNLKGAISNEDGELALIDPGLSDWGFRTEPIQVSSGKLIKTVQSISPASVLAHEKCANTTPLIFKIDIEGGESSLFEGGTEWMNYFPLLIIELHDWMLPFSGSSRNFIKAVAAHDFDFVHRGENIFLFNRKILAP